MTSEEETPAEQKTPAEQWTHELEHVARRGGDAAGEAWAQNFQAHARRARRIRRLMRSLPSEPRCKFCYAPFGGVGGRLLKATGFRPSRKSPNLCDICVERGPAGGFEARIGVLFGDVRGFTSFAEARSPSETAATMERFYAAATRAVIEHGGIVDKLVGDEVMALFFPILMEGEPCAAMVSAAEQLLRSVGDAGDAGARLPVGVGVDFGDAYIGNVGSEHVRDFTALGDVVNTAARLQAAAGAGQILLSDCVYEAVRDRHGHAERVELDLKGKSGSVVAYAVTVTEAPA